MAIHDNIFFLDREYLSNHTQNIPFSGERDGDEAMQGMDYSVSSSPRCGRGFAGSRGWLQGPGASRGPCQGGGGPCQGVPKQQRDRSFQSTWRGEGSGAAKKEEGQLQKLLPNLDALLPVSDWMPRRITWFGNGPYNLRWVNEIFK